MTTDLSRDGTHGDSEGVWKHRRKTNDGFPQHVAGNALAVQFTTGAAAVVLEGLEGEFLQLLVIDG